MARTFQNLRLFSQPDRPGQCQGRPVLLAPNPGPFPFFSLPCHKREEDRDGQKVKEVLSLFGARLTGYRFDQKAMFLSYANRSRLEIARAMATEAKVLMLDEPSAGMNPQETVEMTGFIKYLRDQFGYTIIVIEHKLNVVRTISDRVIALDYGRKIAEGTYDEVANDEEVIEAYFGRKRTLDHERDPHPGTGRRRYLLRKHSGSLRHQHPDDHGELICLLGGNASGKSTTLKTILESADQEGNRQARG